MYKMILSLNFTEIVFDGPNSYTLSLIQMIPWRRRGDNTEANVVEFAYVCVTRRQWVNEASKWLANHSVPDHN